MESGKWKVENEGQILTTEDTDIHGTTRKRSGEKTMPKNITFRGCSSARRATKTNEKRKSEITAVDG